MITEAQIREQIGRFLNDPNAEALDSFEEWLARSSWNMHKDSPLGAQKLVGRIQGYLAEFSNDHLSEKELREKLRAFVVNYVVVISFDTASAAYSSIGESGAKKFQGSFVGRLTSEASV